MILAEFILWHYTQGFRELFRAWMSIQRFFVQFFSLPLLFKTFFTPYRRMYEKRNRGFDAENFLEIVTINLVTRIVGILIRVILIAVGVVIECIVFVVGFSFFILALLAPVAVPALFVIGVFLLLS